MLVTINRGNIDRYRSGEVDPAVTDLCWCVGSFDAGVLCLFPNLLNLVCSLNDMATLDGIEVCTKLVRLSCLGCGLVSIEALRLCANLQVLLCGDNKLRSLAGIEGCTQLQELYCHRSMISSLKHLSQCSMLRVLVCRDNNLESLDGVQNCKQLRNIRCSFNRLTTLNHINSCVRLKYLDCCNNQLRSIDIEGCTRLRKLECFDDDLVMSRIRCTPLLKTLVFSNGMFNRKGTMTTLEGIQRFRHLEKLDCGGHLLTSLAGIETLTHLRKLDCIDNKLTTLAGIELCHNLRELSCDRNQLESMEEIVYLRHLTTISFRINPILTQSLQVVRFLDRLWNVNRSSSVYMDRQNVHDTHVQKTVCDSIQRLLTDAKPTFRIESVLESNLSDHTKQRLVEYCEDMTVHSVHLLTYAELLAHIWARITRSEYRDELVRILDEQIQDAECMCFTGRFNRTLSVLVGFYDDIVISISDNSRISAIIIAAGAMPGSSNPAQHRELAYRKLIDAGYSLEQVQPWLDAIHEQD